MKSINAFKSQNRSLVDNISNSVSATRAMTTVTDAQAYNGIVKIAVASLIDSASGHIALKNFPYSGRIINAWGIAKWGKAAHAIQVTRSASSASSVLSIPMIAAVSGYSAATRIVHDRTSVTAGDTLWLVASGLSFAKVTGTIYLQVLPE